MDKNIIIFLTILSATTLLGCIETVTITVETQEEAPVELPTDQMVVETMESVISAWEDVKDVRITQKQRNSLYKTKIYLVSQVELQSIFHTTSTSLLGKSTNDGIWVCTDGGQKQQTWIMAHELTHRLAAIIQVYGNDCHDDKTIFSCKDSVEQTAIRYMDAENAYQGAYRCGVSTCLK